MKILDMAKRALGVNAAEVEKRNGVFVSRRLLPHNAQKWHDWAVKHGIPNVLAPEDMHVTILHSKVDVKVPLVETTMNIRAVGDGYCGGACFAMFGPDEEDLVLAFSNWELHDRHWAFLSAGGQTDWPTYRPHLRIAKDVADFELPDAALQDVPTWIILGPEENADLKLKAEVVKSDSLLPVSDDLAVAAAELVKYAGDKMSIIDAYDLADISKGRLSSEVSKRLADEPWLSTEVKSGLAGKITEARKKVEKEWTLQVSELPEDIIKKLKNSEIAKNNDEEQIVMGIASVSTVEGELVKDLHGDEVTTKALVEFNRNLISGSRAGKFDHDGDVCTEVVAGLVLTEDWQRALGIELGYEPYLVEIHVPDPVDWAEVKKGEWMLSVAGRMWYYEDVQNEV